MSIVTVNHSIDAIMLMCGNPPTTSRPESYAAASQRTYSKKKFQPKAPRPKQSNVNNIHTLQTKQIVDYHIEGSRTLIIMRGVPGSGKSYLAKQLLLTMCPDASVEKHVLSTDDFFYNAKNVYKFDKFRLDQAHLWNQNRALQAMQQGISPIFIDNTNVEVHHMYSYVKDGVHNGYIIEVLEPNTPWAKKANLLAEKNTHQVPIGTIRRMLEKYQNEITGLYLIRAFNLSYSSGNKPPVLRNYPAIFLPNISQNLPTNPPRQEHSVFPPTAQANMETISSSPTNPNAETTVGQFCDTNSPGPSSSENWVLYPPTLNSMTIDSDDVDSPRKNITAKHETAVEELATRFEEMEHAWENGESWDVCEDITSGKKNGQERPDVPQPPRASENVVHTDTFLPPILNCNDWSQIAMFMPQWTDNQNEHSKNSPAIRVETDSKGTSVESGDTDMNNRNLKILIGTPKDINFYYLKRNEERIPETRMLDKSSMTNDHDHIGTEISRCKNEEKHFIAFRKMFKNIPKVALRDIFDKCVGDVNWAVDIVLECMENRELQTLDSDDFSDSDDAGDDQCECLAAYNIIPNINSHAVGSAANILPEVEPAPIAGPSNVKVKKEKLVLESSLYLKRQIEQNIVISDDHYSNHCLKIRKMRRGENYTRGESPENKSETSSTGAPNTASGNVSEAPSTDTDEESIASNGSNEGQKTVNVDLGPVFIKELDRMYGRGDVTYPENIDTRVNLPMPLLNEIHAAWLESQTNQFDQNARQSQSMLRQDEDFAR